MTPMGLIGLYAACWPGMAVLAVLNGIVRQKTYGRRLPEIAAHQVSSIVLIALIGFYAWILAGVFPIHSLHRSAEIGALWLILTAAFEFLFGRFAMKHSWEALRRDYRIDRGRLWLLVLIWTGATPVVLRLAAGG